jgi:hypothetical protein
MEQWRIWEDWQISSSNFSQQKGKLIGAVMTFLPGMMLELPFIAVPVVD